MPLGSTFGPHLHLPKGALAGPPVATIVGPNGPKVKIVKILTLLFLRCKTPLCPGQVGRTMFCDCISVCGLSYEWPCLVLRVPGPRIGQKCFLGQNVLWTKRLSGQNIFKTLRVKYDHGRGRNVIQPYNGDGIVGLLDYLRFHFSPLFATFLHI